MRFALRRYLREPYRVPSAVREHLGGTLQRKGEVRMKTHMNKFPDGHWADGYCGDVRVMKEDQALILEPKDKWVICTREAGNIWTSGKSFNDEMKAVSSAERLANKRYFQ